MSLTNLIKAVFFFISAVFVIGILSLIYGAFTNSSAWNIVPNGFAKYLAMLVPLILLFGFFIIAVKMATKDKGDKNQ
jgi:hypothetical protein